jgi:Chalcone isomerase-like
LTTLTELMKANPVARGDQVFLTHVPGVGMHVNLVGKKELLIRSVSFTRAVWEIYLGKSNLGDAIKKGLVSRL